MKVAIGIEYCGLNYHGWQRQQNAVSIQAHIEQALSQVANDDIEVYCAGRTDRGVHAVCQVAHFQTEIERPISAWVNGANVYLPSDIKVLWAKPVAVDFHARFNAISRRYRYWIHNHPVAPAIFHGRCTHYPYQVSEALMHQAAQCLIGEHDFTSFRAAGCQSKSCCRHVEFVKVSRDGGSVFIDIQANAFLYHMVRNIVGSLLIIGEKKQPPEWMHNLLIAKDRTLAAPTAPAAGLYFVQANYSQIEFA